jgi:hypothetical protein
MFMTLTIPRLFFIECSASPVHKSLPRLVTAGPWHVPTTAASAIRDGMNNVTHFSPTSGMLGESFSVITTDDVESFSVIIIDDDESLICRLRQLLQRISLCTRVV